MSDYIVRAAAADLQIRAFAITSRELVEKARSIHNTSPVATAALGRLLSAGSMMGAMMKGEQDLLTLQIKGDGRPSFRPERLRRILRTILPLRSRFLLLWAWVCS